MKRLALMLALAAPLLIAARPGSDLQLLTQLNGQPVRWMLVDGGQSGIFTQYDAGAANAMACAILAGTLGGSSFTPNVVLAVPEVPVNVCVRPMVNANGVALSWDGGCNGSTSDINAGVPVQAWQPYYVVLDPKATTICMYSDAGYVRSELNWMR